MIEIADGRKELYQWDTGRTVTVAGQCREFHFSNKVYGRTVDVAAEAHDGACSAKIPDILLQSSADLTVYAWTGTELDGYTREEQVFRIHARPKPADYIFTPQEQQLATDVRAAAEQAQTDALTATTAARAAREQADRAQDIVDNFDPGSGSGGTSDHSKLYNRNRPDQHPIEAITGLQEALDGKAPSCDDTQAGAAPWSGQKVQEAIDSALGGIDALVGGGF